MKNLALVILCFTLATNSQAQIDDFIGTWNISEFSVQNGDEINEKTDDILKEEGAVWDLIFYADGKVKQSSNMRIGSIESQDGTWELKDDDLILSLQLSDRKIEIIYNYVIKKDVLALKRSNPMGTMTINVKFRKS